MVDVGIKSLVAFPTEPRHAHECLSLCDTVRQCADVKAGLQSPDFMEHGVCV